MVKKPEKKDTSYLDINKELLQCLENESGSYLVTEKDDLVEIPLDEITNNSDKIAYYKGVYASAHPDNMYVIIVEKNKVMDADVLENFEKYFSQKFAIFQEYEIATEGISIYINSPDNNINFNEIKNKCFSSSTPKTGKSLSDKTINKINETTKIIIKKDELELGTINDKNKLNEMLNNITNVKQYGDAFLCDGHTFDFELYNNKNELIDTIYVWNDGKRLIPKSLHNGCSYYTSNNIDLRKIIENETDYVFYNIADWREGFNTNQELIYSNDQYNYYLEYPNSDKVLISFNLTNQKMNIKYAINNNYISAENIYKDYPSILIRTNK